MVAFHCVTCAGCTAYSRANCATVLSPSRASNPTLALKAALCRLRFAFIDLLFLIYSRPAKIETHPWSKNRGPPLGSGVALYTERPLRGNRRPAAFDHVFSSSLRVETSFSR